MKKFAPILLSVLIIFSSCDASQESEDTSGSQESQSQSELHPVSVGVSLSTLDDNYLSILKQALEEQGDTSLSVNILDAEGNAGTQSTDIQQLIADGADTLIVSLVDLASARSVADLALAADVSVVFLYSQPASDILSQYENVFFVGVNEIEAGMIQGEMVLRDFAENPDYDLNSDGILQYMVLKGEEANPLTATRTDSLIQTLTDGSAVPIAQPNADWNTDVAARLVAELLEQGQTPEAIVCNSDSMALGAIEALKAADTLVPVYGIDAIPTAIDAIENDEMAGTIYNNPYRLAEESLNVAASYARGETVSNSAGVVRIAYELVQTS